MYVLEADDAVRVQGAQDRVGNKTKRKYNLQSFLSAGITIDVS